MEHYLKQSNSVKGVEVLYFPDAQVDKVKETAKSFSSVGGLSVLYFSDYHRYVLQINDWKYPLVRRLPVVAYDKTNLTSRTYMLPTANGFAFIVKLNNIPNLQILANFEQILSNNSKFSYHGEISLKKLEESPDDKLYRHKLENTGGFFDKISETFKSGIEKMKIKKETLQTGTKNLTSRKKRLNINEIKNKRFRKIARPTFSKDFFDSSLKESNHFLKLRRENPNILECRQLSDLTKGDLPSIYTSKDDLENFILNNKELAASGKVNLVIHQESVSQGTSNLLGRETGLRGTAEKIEPTKMTTFEHYSG